jgi:CheY-like chemotaxis protein
MTAILGFSDLLMAQNVSQTEQREFVDGIQRNGKALLELIGDILDLSRIEADKLTLEKRDCLLQQIVDDVLAVVQVRARAKQLCLVVDRQYPLPERIHTDPLRLRQILVNLAGNAVKFTERGEVRIAVRCLRQADETARVQFAVSDTGIGIPADKVGGLFQAFVQADASAGRRYGGAGLGLAICHRLATALGGNVQVVSEVGKGSTFTLTIDAGSLQGVAMLQSASPALAAADEPAADQQERMFHGRLLLVEDEPDLQRIIRLLLRKMNLVVSVAGTGQMACDMATLSQAEGKPYDLILMDIQMPGMNGLEATQMLRNRGWQGPIIALTAHAMIGDRERCLAAGCSDYIAKPIIAAGLQDVLAQHMAQAATRQSVEKVVG